MNSIMLDVKVDRRDPTDLYQQVAGRAAGRATAAPRRTGPRTAGRGIRAGAMEKRARARIREHKRIDGRHIQRIKSADGGEDGNAQARERVDRPGGRRASRRRGARRHRSRSAELRIAIREHLERADETEEEA